ncbi:MAG: YitT family protein [Clostridia bacterium]|nr:YitT family protein [Clostridia bacterium]
MKKILPFLMMTLGTFLVAAEVYFFEIPNKFAAGGVSGISIILSRFIPLSAETWIVILNVILLIIGFIFLGKGCGFKTVYCTLLYAGLLKLFEWLIPISQPLTDEPVIELLSVMVLLSIGGALVFRADATTGGTDIIAMILKKYTPLHVGKALFLVDFLVVLSAFFVYGFKIGLFSLFGLLARALFTDTLIENMDSCKWFTIITSKPDEICDFILKNLDRGATIVKGTGAFTGEGKTILNTVVQRSESYKLQKAIKEIDKSAFIIITTSSEIIGSGFRDM